jgi:hypothetical protein
MQGETKLYQTNASRSTRPQLSIQLPNNQEDIQYIDEHDIAQINPEAIATLQITLKDNKGNPLESVANITSTHGILHPGTIITNNITR